MVKEAKNMVEEAKEEAKNMVEEAREEAREEAKNKVKEEKLEIAKNLLDVLDSETIAIKTGLSIDEINKLRTV